MFRNYVVAIIGAAIAVVTLVAVGIYQATLDPENTKYDCAFNSASIERKIIGKRADYVAQRYLPPVSAKKKSGKGNFVAHYDDVAIFTRGEKTVVHGMDITYADSVATAISFSEPVKSKDAAILNACPLCFKLIDAEFMTKTKGTVETKKAPKGMIPLAILLLFILSNIPFLLLWPFSTWLIKKEVPMGALIAIVSWLLLYWIYIGILAYSNGTAILFLVLAVIWVAIAAGKILSSRPADDYVPEVEDYEEDIPDADADTDDYLDHVSNLAIVLALAGLGKNPSQNRAMLVADIANRHHLPADKFQTVLEKPDMQVNMPRNESLKAEFIENFCKILLCDTSFSDVQFGAVMTMVKGLGITEDEAQGALAYVAKTYYGKALSDYTILKTQ